MANQMGQNGASRPPRKRRPSGWTIRVSPVGLIFLAVIYLAVLGGGVYGISLLVQHLNQVRLAAAQSPTSTFLAASTTQPVVPSNTPTYQPTTKPSATSTILPFETPTSAVPTASPQPMSTLTINQGLLILALDEGGNTHLFAYQPAESGFGQPLPLTRLTYGPWDDITPAISPDGQTVAFASNRSGYWDIYLLDLSSSAISRLTDTPGYEAAPSWSPDNQWLVYEAYLDNNLELVIQSIANPSDVIRLTNNQAADFSPAWSPQGRQIAYVSNQTGEDQIWLADLDKSENGRFQNISQDPEGKVTHPVWSPDGSEIAWVDEHDGMRSIYLQKSDFSGDNNLATQIANRLILGNGDWPAFSSDGETVLTILETPNHIYLTAYPSHQPGLSLPTIELPGAVCGFSWSNNPLTPMLKTIYQQAAQATSTPIYLSAISSPPEENGGRYQLAPLGGIQVPQPYLHDMVDESFMSLRTHIAGEAGWDFLSSLENAYVPLTSPLDPGMGNDWLYTGRAFAVNTLPMNAGWMVVVREDFGADTYWRVYIRARFQDGSAGIPLHDLPWDFDSRYDGDTTIYEQGGQQKAAIPPGYWIDFTERARAYGWERLPALITWRAFSPAARFNEFAATGGLSWQAAMLQLYPPEALVTPTAVIPPTRTPTPTLRWYVSPTPTKIPTSRPTFTPFPTTPANPLPQNLAPTSTPTPGG